MATRTQKTKVGIFLVSCALIIAGALLLISGFKHEERIPYWIEFNESVMGLGSGGSVLYMGLKVGTVADMYVTEQNKAHVEVLITKGKVTLHEGVTAKLEMMSLATGTMCVSLSGGDLNKPELLPKAQIPSENSLLKAVSMQIEDIMASLNKILERLDKAMEGMKDGDLTRVVENADELLIRGQQFLDTTRETVSKVGDQANQELTKFNELTLDVQVLVKNTNDAVKKITKKVESLKIADTEQNVNEVLDDISALSKRLQESAKSIDAVAKTATVQAGNVEYSMRETLRTLNDSLDAVRELTQYLKQDPSALLRGKGKPVGDR